MNNFFEICKVLVSTDTFYKDGMPHAAVTSIDYFTQKNPGLVEFDYEKIYDREDRYHDVIGFYHTHPSGMNYMSATDVETMTQWVKCFGKSLLCLIETKEQLNAWIFTREKNEIKHRPVSVHTSNDVNYDVWLDSHGAFWNPIDFILDAEHFDEEMDEEEKAFNELVETVHKVAGSQIKVLEGLTAISEVLQELVHAITEDEEDEQES